MAAANEDVHGESRGGAGGAGAPFKRHRGVLQVTVTNRCQCACPHCGVRDINRAPHGRELSLAEIDRILRDAAAAGFGIIDIYGGEPTLRDDLVDIVRLAAGYGLHSVLETNALRLDEDYLVRLRDAGIGRIYVSLDSVTKEYHDANRGRPTFDHAVWVMNACRRLGIDVHSAIVPRDEQDFLSGRFNEYVAFCLANGARKVRILFPCYVGSMSGRPMHFTSEASETELFSCVAEAYRPLVYVSAEMASLDQILAGTAVRCPMKSIFCHVTSAGLFMPCPYLPLVFGDLKRESLHHAFERVQEHPVIRKGALYCPSRDRTYLESVLGQLRPDQPYLEVRSDNRIDLGGRCNNRCQGCTLADRPATRDDVLRQVAALDPLYRAVHVFGGEPLLRDDAFELLAEVGPRFPIHLYSNARLLANGEWADRLRQLNVGSVRVPFFAFEAPAFDAWTQTPGSFQETLQGVRNLVRAGVPVQVFATQPVSAAALQLLQQLGVQAVSEVQTEPASEPLPDTVLCFGRRITHNRLVWLDFDQFEFPIRME